MKQEDKEPNDRSEPKFKVGDWIVANYGKVSQIVSVYKDGDGYFLDDGTYIKGSWCDLYHLWTIKDAKDGDVLHSTGWHNDCIFIYNGLDYWRFSEPNGDRAVATGYCCLFVSADNMEFGIQGPDCIEVNTIKPATKIARDLLFRKMHVAGYEWDAEKKELKKIEQKPNEWKQENVKELTEFENAMMHIGGSFFGENAGLDPNDTNTVKEQAQYLLELAQNSIRSEEDERNLDRFISWIKILKQRIGK